MPKNSSIFSFELLVWMSFLISFPFYFFSAGSMQISTFIIGPFAFYLLFTGKLSKTVWQTEILRAFKNLLLYIFFVNIVLFLFLIGDAKIKGNPLITNFFYLYNAIVFSTVFYLFNKYKKHFLKATLIGLFIGAFFSVALSEYAPERESVRGSLFFAEVNQLGYYSLICMVIFLLLQKAIKMPSYLIYAIIALCFYMAAVSLSTAAIYSIIILFGIYFFESGVLSFKKLAILIVVIAGGLFALFNTEFGQNTIERYTYRIETSVREQAGVSELEYRGYDRIINHSEYLVLGAGEGAYDRFETFIEDHEMHSSFGTILFSYGLPGSILFLILIFKCLKGLKTKIILYSLPIFAYGIAHMGLRFTLFWIALALFPVLRQYSIEYYSNRNVSVNDEESIDNEKYLIQAKT